MDWPLYAELSTEEPDGWTIFHSAWCDYNVDRETVNLVLKLRTNYPGGNELISGAATFEPIDTAWIAVVWTRMGIRLDAVAGLPDRRCRRHCVAQAPSSSVTVRVAVNRPPGWCRALRFPELNRDRCCTAFAAIGAVWVHRLVLGS